MDYFLIKYNARWLVIQNVINVRCKVFFVFNFIQESKFNSPLNYRFLQYVLAEYVYIYIYNWRFSWYEKQRRFYELTPAPKLSMLQFACSFNYCCRAYLTGGNVINWVDLVIDWWSEYWLSNKWFCSTKIIQIMKIIIM